MERFEFPLKPLKPVRPPKKEKKSYIFNILEVKKEFEEFLTEFYGEPVDEKDDR